MSTYQVELFSVFFLFAIINQMTAGMIGMYIIFVLIDNTAGARNEVMFKKKIVWWWGHL